MNLSFREKGLLISLGALLFVYGGYFLELNVAPGPRSLALMLAEMMGLVIGLVVIHVVFFTVIAIFDRPAESGDERDKAIERRAAVVSGFVLGAGVVTITARIIILGAWGEADGVTTITLFEIANLLLFAMVLSEVVHYATQLYFYRRGV